MAMAGGCQLETLETISAAPARTNRNEEDAMREDAGYAVILHIIMRHRMDVVQARSEEGGTTKGLTI
jgi:hypothetical protein